MRDSRAVILDALRAALADAPLAPEVPARPLAWAPAPDWKELANEWKALGARFALARTAAEARGALASLARELGVRRAVVWEHPALERLGVAETLVRGGAAVISLEQRSGDFLAEAAECELGVTAADALILESATLVVLAGPGRERAASLLPPAHLAFVTRETQILNGIADLGPWVEAQKDASGLLPSAIHCITGPSATADIELVKVRGVHGPVMLAVVGVEEAEE